MAVDFKAKQAEFAGYIRNPGQCPMPNDVAANRMAMYRELFFNNIDSFLSSNFPVLRSLLSDGQWQELAQDFYSVHSCTTPYFSEIAEEFLDYLQNQRKQPEDYPFLLELAHYEWVEMALSIAKEAPEFGDPQFVAEVMQRPLRLSPLAWPLAYRFPVQRICTDFLPLEAPEQATYLIVYRDAYDDVHFMQTTPFTFSLLQLIEQHPAIDGSTALQTLAGEMPQLSLQQLSEFGAQTLQEMARKGIVIPAGCA